MSKSWRGKTDRKYQSDDLTVYSKNEIEYREHKKEKRLEGAIKSKNLDVLVEDEECEYCPDHVPIQGYWRCPECDAEWNIYDEGDDDED